MQPRGAQGAALASMRARGVPLLPTGPRPVRLAPAAATAGLARGACGSAVVSPQRRAHTTRRGATLPARFSAVPVAAPVPEQAAEVALPLPTAVESAADDPLLHNPLQRMQRMGTGWFGLVADYEGVVVDSTLEVHKEAWRQVARDMRLPMPLGSALDRIRGVRDDAVRAAWRGAHCGGRTQAGRRGAGLGLCAVWARASAAAAQPPARMRTPHPSRHAHAQAMSAAPATSPHRPPLRPPAHPHPATRPPLQIIMQLFSWSRNPSAVAAIAARKEELYDSLMNNNTPAEVPGVRTFLESLSNFNVRPALAGGGIGGLDSRGSAGQRGAARRAAPGARAHLPLECSVERHLGTLAGRRPPPPA